MVNCDSTCEFYDDKEKHCTRSIAIHDEYGNCKDRKEKRPLKCPFIKTSLDCEDCPFYEEGYGAGTKYMKCNVV